MLREEPLHFAENQHEKEKQNITISTIQQQNKMNKMEHSGNNNETNRILSFSLSSNNNNKKKKKAIVKYPINNNNNNNNSFCLLMKKNNNNTIYQHDQQSSSFTWKKENYHLPSFLTKKASSSYQHLYAMWMNATLKPDVKPIFWMNLSSSQKLINRSRLKKRISRYHHHHHHHHQHIFNRRFLKRHDKSQWYGIFPIPPTFRTRFIWFTQQDDDYINFSLPFSTTILNQQHHHYHNNQLNSINMNNINNDMSINNHDQNNVTIDNDNNDNNNNNNNNNNNSNNINNINNNNNNINSDKNTKRHNHNSTHQNHHINSSINKKSNNNNNNNEHNNKHHLKNQSYHEEKQSAQYIKQQKKLRLKAWTPPINSETLQELCMANIFRSIQLRHDLLFDPGLSFRPNLDGASGREKCKKAEKYWRKVDKAFKELRDQFFSTSVTSSSSNNNNNIKKDHHYGNTMDDNRFDFLVVLFTELRDILITLYNPFASSPATHESWSWPNHITLNHLKVIFDVDFIIQQIKFGQTDFLDPFIKVLYTILTALCPLAEIPRLELLKQYLVQEKYAKALRQCFSILETIKLDCANRILRDYRTYLVETCAQVEYQCFRKQLEQEEIRIESTYKWLFKTWQRVGKKSQFVDIYHKGLVYLISDDIYTIRSLGLKSVPFPITLQFNERRITQQFRHEFQSILLVFILLIPYRYLAGNFASVSDMTRLKRSCIELCKDSMASWSEKYGVEIVDLMSLFNQSPCSTLTPEEHRKEVLRICYRLAYKVCHRAFQAHIRHFPSSTSTSTSPSSSSSSPNTTPESLNTDQLIHVSQFWANWLMIHLKTNSPVYHLIYHRLCHLLSFISQHGVYQLEKQSSMIRLMDRMIGIQENVIAFGEKIKMLADLNLATFSPIYRVLSLDIIQSV
ncbi:unnamed protein product [Cunninghamella blakesleeana]